MGARESQETRHGLDLIAKGMSVRKAAKVSGVATSTLWRAQERRKAAEQAKPTAPRIPPAPG